jgi:non-ribosomal peptide synthetase component F
LLAILKSGAAYVPIDPAYPADRVSYILGDAKVPILLTSSTLPMFHEIYARHAHVESPALTRDIRYVQPPPPHLSIYVGFLPYSRKRQTS